MLKEVRPQLPESIFVNNALRSGVNMSQISGLKTEPKGRCFHHLGIDDVIPVYHFDTGKLSTQQLYLLSRLNSG